MLQDKWMYNYDKNFIKLSFEKEIEKDHKEKRKHYVLWSGGCDSTLLLYDLLHAYDPEDVYAISMIYPYLHDKKVDMEREYRDDFKQWLQKECPERSNFNHIEVNIGNHILNGQNVQACANGLPQPIGWLFYISLYATPNSVVWFGHNRDDDIAIYWRDIDALHERIKFILGKNFDIRCPFLFVTKSIILKRLIALDLYERTWFCELCENDTPCQRCASCGTHLNGLLDIAYCNKQYTPGWIREYASSLASELIVPNKCDEEENKKETAVLKDKDGKSLVDVVKFHEFLQTKSKLILLPLKVIDEMPSNISDYFGSKYYNSVIFLSSRDAREMIESDFETTWADEYAEAIMKFFIRDFDYILAEASEDLLHALNVPYTLVIPKKEHLCTSRQYEYLKRMQDGKESWPPYIERDKYQDYRQMEDYELFAKTLYSTDPDVFLYHLGENETLEDILLKGGLNECK